MASPELQRLWKLAQTDNAIESIKRRAASLDAGQAIAAQIAKLEASDELKAAAAIRAEVADLELKQKGITEKIQRVEKQLYDGKVVNAREVENLQKDIEAQKRQRATHDERVLELYEALAPAEERAKTMESQLAEAKTRLAEQRKKALQEKTEIEQEFKRLAAARPDLAKAVANPTLLARYDSIRKRHNGIGMVQITKQLSCGGCGTQMPERTIELLKDDRIAVCESCHRLLYYTEGLV